MKKRPCIENYLKPAESMQHIYEMPTESRPRRPLPSTDDAVSHDYEGSIAETEPYLEIPDNAYSVPCSGRSWTNTNQPQSKEILDLEELQAKTHLPDFNKMNSYDPETLSHSSVTSGAGEAENKYVTILQEEDTNQVPGLQLQQSIKFAHNTPELVYEEPD